MYHGSYTPGVLQKVIRTGLRGQVEQGRAKLAPMKGRVYMTPQLRYAIIYAIGGDMLGHKQPPSRIKPGERYGYVFEISPDDLTDDIIPDEDVVGDALAAAYEIDKFGRHNEFSELDKELLQHPSLVRSLASLFHVYTRDVPSVRRGALDGMIADQARLGKRVLKYMGRNDPIMRQLLQLNAVHQSHGGPVMPIRAWRIDRRLTHKLAKDGSNFFDVAKLVWDRRAVTESRIDLTELIGYDEVQQYIPGVVKTMMGQFGGDSGLEYDAYSRFTDQYYGWIESVIGEEPNYNNFSDIADEHPDVKQKFWDWLPSFMKGRVEDAYHDIVSRSSHQNGLVSLYRVIRAPTDWFPDHIADRPLGIYWSFEMDSAEAHWGGGDGYNWMIEARAPISAINWPVTLENKIIYEGEDEIRIHEGTPVEVDEIYVQKYHGDHWLLPDEMDPKYPVFKPIQMTV